MRHTRFGLFQRFDIRIINVNTVRQQWAGLQYTVIVEVLNRRNSERLPFNATVAKSISKWPAAVAYQRYFHRGFGRVHHHWKTFVKSKLRNHSELRSANCVRSVWRHAALDQSGFVLTQPGDFRLEFFKIL